MPTHAHQFEAGMRSAVTRHWLCLCWAAGLLQFSQLQEMNCSKQPSLLPGRDSCAWRPSAAACVIASVVCNAVLMGTYFIQDFLTLHEARQLPEAAIPVFTLDSGPQVAATIGKQQSKSPFVWLSVVGFDAQGSKVTAQSEPVADKLLRCAQVEARSGAPSLLLHQSQARAQPTPDPRCLIPGDGSARHLRELPSIPSYRQEPSGMAKALELCPGLKQCRSKQQPVLYPVIAHRNRLGNLAKYVASLAAVGHGFYNTSKLAVTQNFLDQQQPGFSSVSGLPWWDLVADTQEQQQKPQPGARGGAGEAARRIQPWAQCTCILISDFNTTFPAFETSGDPLSEWSLQKHGPLRDLVNSQWPGHVAWVNNPEPFSSALANTRGWSAIPTDPERSIVHISVADLLHTHAEAFEFAVQGTLEGRTAYLPITWYSFKPNPDLDMLAGATCVAQTEGLGQWTRDGSGVVFAYLSDIKRSGGYSPGMMKRTKWGHEDWDLVCALQKSGVTVVRNHNRAFCHLWHLRNFDREASPDGMAPSPTEEPTAAA